MDLGGVILREISQRKTNTMRFHSHGTFLKIGNERTGRKQTHRSRERTDGCGRGSAGRVGGGGAHSGGSGSAAQWRTAARLGAARAAGRTRVESLRRTPETNVTLCDDYSIFKKKSGSRPLESPRPRPGSGPSRPLPHLGPRPASHPPQLLPAALARGPDTVRWVGTGSFARLPVSQWVRQ